MKFVIGLEGLGQGNSGPLKKMLAAEKIPASIYSYRERPKLPEGPVIICCHSFGATGAFKIARPGDIIIACDPRHADKPLAMMFDSFTRIEYPFQAPKGVVVHNFYRRGFALPGQPVNGGFNYLLPSTVSHMAVPNRTEVRQMLRELLK